MGLDSHQGVDTGEGRITDRNTGQYLGEYATPPLVRFHDV